MIGDVAIVSFDDWGITINNRWVIRDVGEILKDRSRVSDNSLIIIVIVIKD